jgi:hypothetical protein
MGSVYIAKRLNFRIYVIYISVHYMYMCMQVCVCVCVFDNPPFERWSLGLRVWFKWQSTCLASKSLSLKKKKGKKRWSLFLPPSKTCTWWLPWNGLKVAKWQYWSPRLGHKETWGLLTILPLSGHSCSGKPTVKLWDFQAVLKRGP